MNWGDWLDLKIMDLLFIIGLCVGIILLGLIFMSVLILTNKIKNK